MAGAEAFGLFQSQSLFASSGTDVKEQKTAVGLRAGFRRCLGALCRLGAGREAGGGWRCPSELAWRRGPSRAGSVGEEVN